MLSMGVIGECFIILHILSRMYILLQARVGLASLRACHSLQHLFYASAASTQLKFAGTAWFAPLLLAGGSGTRCLGSATAPWALTCCLQLNRAKVLRHRLICCLQEAVGRASWGLQLHHCSSPVLCS
jgi:hypothetical protein